MIRSFLAIELPEAIRNKIDEIQGDLKSSHADVRWVNPEKIHLTLKFFGNIEEARVESIIKAIENPVRNTPVFSLEGQRDRSLSSLEKPQGDLDGIDR